MACPYYKTNTFFADECRAIKQNGFDEAFQTGLKNDYCQNNYAVCPRFIKKEQQKVI